jgi:hypothetical protein
MLNFWKATPAYAERFWWPLAGAGGFEKIRDMNGQSNSQSSLPYPIVSCFGARPHGHLSQSSQAQKMTAPMRFTQIFSRLGLKRRRGPSPVDWRESQSAVFHFSLKCICLSPPIRVFSYAILLRLALRGRVIGGQCLAYQRVKVLERAVRKSWNIQ